MEQASTNNTQAPGTSREECLAQIAKMDDETLRILADLSKRQGVEQKLKDKYPMIKLFL